MSATWPRMAKVCWSMPGAGTTSDEKPATLKIRPLLSSCYETSYDHLRKMDAGDELVRRAASKRVEQLAIRLHRIRLRVGKACGGSKVSGHILRGGVPFRELWDKVKKRVKRSKLDTRPRKVENGGKIEAEKRFSL
jgi:hypothetical protein